MPQGRSWMRPGIGRPRTATFWPASGVSSMNATTSLKIPMPVVGAVEAADGLRVRVTWGGGLRGSVTELVDLSPLIDAFKFYRPLRADRDLFRTVRVAEDGH